MDEHTKLPNQEQTPVELSTPIAENAPPPQNNPLPPKVQMKSISILIPIIVVSSIGILITVKTYLSQISDQPSTSGDKVLVSPSISTSSSIFDEVKSLYPNRDFQKKVSNFTWATSSGAEDIIETGISLNLVVGDDNDANIVDQSTSIMEKAGYTKNDLNMIGGDAGGTIFSYQKDKDVCHVGITNTYKGDDISSSEFQLTCAKLTK